MGRCELHLARRARRRRILRLHRRIRHRVRELPVSLPFHRGKDKPPARHHRHEARHGVQRQRARFSHGAPHRRSYPDGERRGVPRPADLGCGVDGCLLPAVHGPKNTYGRLEPES